MDKYAIILIPRSSLDLLSDTTYHFANTIKTVIESVPADTIDIPGSPHDQNATAGTLLGLYDRKARSSHFIQNSTNESLVVCAVSTESLYLVDQDPHIDGETQKALKKAFDDVARDGHLKEAILVKAENQITTGRFIDVVEVVNPGETLVFKAEEFTRNLVHKVCSDKPVLNL